MACITLHDCAYDGGKTACSCSLQVAAPPVEWTVYEVLEMEQTPSHRISFVHQPAVATLKVYHRQVWCDADTGRKWHAWVRQPRATE